MALELQQLEEEDQQMEGVQKKLKNEMLAEEMKSKFGHSNAKRVLASADNPSPEAAAINELCARYPEIERKYIKIIAGRCR